MKLAVGLAAVVVSMFDTPGTPPPMVALDVFATQTTMDVLLVEGERKPHRLVHRRSVDGGVSWSAPVEVPRGGRDIEGPHRGMDPQIAAAGDAIVVMWTTPGTDVWNDGPLATSASRDGGRTWTPGPNPADDGLTIGHAFLELAADGRGRFHAFWLDSRDGAPGLRASLSSDGGRTWSANRTLDLRTCECCWNKALALQDESLLLLYRDRDPRDMALAASGDGGRSWQRRWTVGAFDWGFNGCPHIGGGLAASSGNGARYLHAAVWTGAEGREGIHALRSSDEGRGWSTPQRLAGAWARHADMAGDGTDVVAVWDETRGGGQAAIMAARSRDHGATWAPATQLALAQQATHPLVVASRDRFVVFWTDKSPSGPLQWHIRRLPDDDVKN